MGCVSFQKNSVTSLDCCLQDNTDLQPASTLIILQCRLLEDSPRWTLQTLSMGRAPSPRCERRINATNLLHYCVCGEHRRSTAVWVLRRNMWDQGRLGEGRSASR
ncbi:hypothetical protein CMEL01_04801 [Colletotrichum melonis]|uniref:Uncharacterized protein n=1 Tax=Colletotrichum melonis TaxID=1209925 RepID=A0AAI9U9Y1_9PEZI|nr:hypothetical protein CMEL01_04801 [Colletotrichum melonis]